MAIGYKLQCIRIFKNNQSFSKLLANKQTLAKCQYAQIPIVEIQYALIPIVKIQKRFNVCTPNLLYITMWMHWLWRGCIGECGPLPSKLGSNTTLRPSAVGWYCTPISQEIGPHSPMHPRQSQRILSVRLKLAGSVESNIIIKGI